MEYIVPKITADGTGYEAIKNVYKDFSKIELQLVVNEYTYTNMPNAYKIYYEQIINFIKLHPEIEELTIHSPIPNYEIESLFMRDRSFIIWTTKFFIHISNKYNKKINILYHTISNYELFLYDWEALFTPVLKLLENTNVCILFENTIFNKEQRKCFPLDLARHYDNKHIKVCLDICHLYCKANIYYMSVEEFLNTYVKQEDLKYVHQIHFSATLNNDGYKDSSTHGKAHPTKKDALKDYKLLKDYGVKNCLWVTEISENDYECRGEQIKEINFLKEIIKN